MRIARLLLVALLSLAACGGDGDDDARPSPTVPAVRTPVPGPSQSATDAQRDGVPAAIAELTFPRRVQDLGRLRAAEGVWVISRPSRPPADLADYAELVLLDRDETRVLRAYPFPELQPKWITLSDAALYCGHPGGRERYTVLCRIDRQTFAPIVRVYTDRLDTWIPANHPLNWQVTGYFLEMADLAVDDVALWSQAENGTWTRLDPNTITFVQPSTPGPAGKTGPVASAEPDR